MNKKKSNSTGMFSTAIVFFICSMPAFFTNMRPVGIVWICAGFIELIIAFIMKKKEKDENNS